MDLNSYLNPTIIASLQAGGYILMLGLMIIEGPIVTFVAGFLASLGMFNIWWVLLFGTLGDIGGDIIFFLIGRYGWKIFQKNTKIDTSKEKKFIEKLDTLIRENMFLSIFIIKFTPYAPPIGISYMGKIRVNLMKYLVNSLFFSLSMPLVVGMLGYHIQTANSILGRYSGKELFFVSIVLILGVMFLVGAYIALRKKSREILEK